MTSFGTFVRFEPLTLGEAILVALTITLPIIGVLTDCLRKRTFAIRIDLDAQRVERGEAKWVHVTLKSRVPMTLERLNVRFVNKKWFGLSTEGASKSDVEIVDLGGVNWRTPYARAHMSASDGEGGYDILFDPPKKLGSW